MFVGREQWIEYTLATIINYYSIMNRRRSLGQRFLEMPNPRTQ